MQVFEVEAGAGTVMIPIFHVSLDLVHLFFIYGRTVDFMGFFPAQFCRLILKLF